MASDTWDWYLEGLQKYQRRQNDRDLFVDFLKNANGLTLDNIESCLSIGPGYGLRDIPICDHLPNLRSYIGVEPNKKLSEKLEGDLQNKLANKTVKIEIVEGKIEDWSGPESPVDLILLLHVLYHIPGWKDLLVKCQQWLSPGGVILVMHSNVALMDEIDKKFNAESRVESKLIASDVIQLFRQLCKNDIYMTSIRVLLDIGDRDQDIMNFLLQRPATNEELQLLDVFLQKVLPTGIKEGEDVCMWWIKPSLPEYP